jgi:large subunit ribosomal protein LX
MRRYLRAVAHMVHMSTYTVTGRWKTPEGWQTFESEIEAVNENVAEEHTYAEFGSRHGLDRNEIEISEVAR